MTGSQRGASDRFGRGVGVGVLGHLAVVAASAIITYVNLQIIQVGIVVVAWLAIVLTGLELIWLIAALILVVAANRSGARSYAGGLLLGWAVGFALLAAAILAFLLG